jgi:hypothetical protein
MKPYFNTHSAGVLLLIVLLAWPSMETIRFAQPHLLPAGPLSRRQPATIGIPHEPGTPPGKPAVSRTRNPSH